MMDWRLSRGVKPDQCKGCPRFARGNGFCPPDWRPTDVVLGVGQHPGPVEGRTGRPYTGGAGFLLNNLLVRAGLSRGSITLTNVVKCAGPEPTMEEAHYCMTQYFADEIKGKKVIASFGSLPAKVLCGLDKVKHERGTVRSFLGIPVVITLEPAGLLWSKSEAKNMGETRDYLPIVIKDLIKVKRIAIGKPEVSAHRELVPHANEAQVESMLDRIEKVHKFGLDIETNFPEGDGKTITMIGLSDRPRQAVTLLPWALQKYRDRLDKIFSDPDKICVGWNNGQFDSWRMRENGWTVKNRQYDAMLADHLIESDMGEFGLEAGASRHLDYEPWKHLSNKDPMRNCLDTSITLELEAKLTERMNELGCYDLLFRHQMPMADLCYHATRIGIRVDEVAMAKAKIASLRIMERYETQLTRLLGPIFNWRSPKQLKELLYDTIGMPVQLHRRTKKPTMDHYATDDLLKLAADPDAPETWRKFRPIIEALIELKKFDKLAGTFLSGADLHPDGRFHPSFLQHRQVTGRLSASNPNVMQLPKGIIRSLILPDNEGDVLLKADFSQIQMRLSGWFSSDKVLTERLDYYDANPLDEFGDKQDVHRLHANRFYGDTRLDRTKRSLSKNMFYGINFGQGAKGLAGMYGVEVEYAQRFIDFLWSEYPQLKRWRDGILNTIEDRNYLKNPYHRIRWLWNKNFATEAFIYLPQSTEYDMLAESAIELGQKLPAPARQLMWVHDEIVVTSPPHLVAECAEIMHSVMSKPREILEGFACPVEVTQGKNYDEASAEVGLAGDWRRLRRTVR